MTVYADHVTVVRDGEKEEVIKVPLKIRKCNQTDFDKHFSDSKG